MRPQHISLLALIVWPLQLWRAEPTFRAELASGEILLGTPVTLSEAELVWKSNWAGTLRLPRGVLRQVNSKAIPLPSPERERDRLFSPAGGTLFGSCESITAEGVQFRSRLGLTKVKWGEKASAVSFRREPIPGRASEGRHVEVRVGEDVLRGVLVDETTLVHPLFGKLGLPADRVRRVRTLFEGRRFVLPVAQVLEDRDEVTREFRFHGPDEGAELIVVGTGTTQLTVTLNGRPVGRMKGEVTEPAPLTLPIRGNRLISGMNRITLRQAGGRCDIHSLRIDIAAPAKE